MKYIIILKEELYRDIILSTLHLRVIIIVLLCIASPSKSKIHRKAYYHYNGDYLFWHTTKSECISQLSRIYQKLLYYEIVPGY